MEQFNEVIPSVKKEARLHRQTNNIKTNENPPKFEAWLIVNELVLSWIVNLVASEIALTIMYIISDSSTTFNSIQAKRIKKIQKKKGKIKKSTTTRMVKK